jgi:hypothetical protein
VPRDRLEPGDDFAGAGRVPPPGARRPSTRRVLPAAFRQDPLTGVYGGITPCANSHGTNAGASGPATSTGTDSTRNGGDRSGRVAGAVDPTCHRSHAARDASAVGGGAGDSAGVAASSRSTQGGTTASVTEVAPATRTGPPAGRDGVGTWAVPPRACSCGCRGGRPSGRRDAPGCGTAWSGPASPAHHTASPGDAPAAYAPPITFFSGRRPGR